ncbi:hypothetical protein JKP88DRAFT_87063 [Tribonema minus]|uniref:Uncharacterized protein n=1 Tax=Tribonema minus TaxID=303371 RepID=A0A835YL76_9STRA|nr:hypothetical protein JKP88DRAFT_87063 [Tribonema minus]
MAPLQRQKCQVEATGPIIYQNFGGEELDHGITLATCPNLKPDLSELPLTKPGTAGERLARSALFRSRVGPPIHYVPLSRNNENHGTVLFTSSTLKPDLSEVPLTKPGTDGERLGRSALFRSRARRPLRDVPVDLAEPNRGTVLCTCPHLQPNMAYSYRTNVAGGRPTERLGVRGGFTPGVVTRAGGPACDVPVAAAPVDRGTVLYTSAALRPDESQELRLKQGTSDERQGRVGSFEHGDAHLRMPTAAEAALWKEAGQKGGRRFAPGHFLAGTTVFAGCVPAY